MENVCLTITSWEIPCMNPVSYTQEWWLCSFSTNFLSCLSGQRTNSVLHQTYLECNKLLMKKKKTRRNCRNSNCLQVMRLLEQTGHSMISGLSFTKIASCRVYAISRRGIEQQGSSFGFILVLIPRKISRGHTHSSRGKSPGSRPSVAALMSYSFKSPWIR